MVCALVDNMMVGFASYYGTISTANNNAFYSFVFLQFLYVLWSQVLYAERFTSNKI